MKRAFILIIAGSTCIFSHTINGQTSRNLDATLRDSIAFEQAIAVSEILAYEQETQVFVSNIINGIEERDDLDEIDNSFTELDSLIQLKTPLSKEEILDAGTIELQNVESAWDGYRTKLSEWNDDLRDRSYWFEEQQLLITRLKTLWSITLDASIEAQAPSEVIQRIRDLQNSIQQIEDQLNFSRNSILQTDVKIADLLVAVNSDLVIVKEAREESVKSITIVESPPLWQVLSSSDEEVEDKPSLKERIDTIIANRSNTVSTYFNSNQYEFYLSLFSFVIFLLFTLFIKRKSTIWYDEYKTKRLKDPVRSNADLVLKKRIISVSVLLSLSFMSLILSNRPVVIIELTVIMAIYPLLRVVNTFSPVRLNPYTNFIGFLFFIGHINNLFIELQPANRTTLFLLSMALCLALGLVLRKNILDELTKGPIKSLVIILIWLGFISQIIAIFSNLVGNVTLANYLVYSFLNIYFISLLIYSITTIFINLGQILVSSPVLQKLLMIQKHESNLVTKYSNILIFFAVLIWLSLFMREFEIRESIIDGISSFFTAVITIGAFEFSLGDIVIFFLVIWISIVLSNTVQYLLEEEIFPRAKTKRGTSATITTFVRVTIITFGFILAIAASGFPMDQFTVLIGAFGVGIGFGLQNIFNNLVSGFIIATERPVEVGDTIEVGTLVGEVRDIGIRSSVVRTYDGAEVIVPNGNLISNELINWTHSDQQRRLKIPIGVAYDSDVHKVIKILNEIGKSDNRILQTPGSYVLFRGFGESSLDFELRCWTSSDDWYILESDLAIKVHDEMKENGIVIPFPQRDLHLKTVDKEIVNQTKNTLPPAKKK